MIRLDSTTKILQLIATGTAGAIVTGNTRTATAYAGFSQETAVTASTQTICAAPGASTVTDIDHVSIKNTQAGANTLTVQLYNSSGPVTTHSMYAVLAQNESLEYTHARGWHTLDASGQEKVAYSNSAYARSDIAQSFTGLQTFNDGISIADGKAITTGASVTIAAAAATALNIGHASAAAAFAGGISIPASKAITGVVGSSTISDFLSVAATNFVSSTTSTTAFAGATVNLTLGGTGATSVVAIPGTKDATNTTTASVTLAGGLAVAKGLSAANFVSAISSIYYVDSFTGTASEFTVAQTGTITYTKIGNVITMDVPIFTGTSNATGFTITGGSASMRPASTKTVVVRSQDNGGAFLSALAQIASSGVISIFSNPSGGAFTTSGTKSLGACSFSYSLV